MNIWGLNIIDALIVVVYLLGMLYIGKLLSKSVKGQDDFYLAGRKLGKLYQFFLNFGNMTDANGAASVASVVYRQGVGGVWIAMQTLFMTPYYWFMNVWFRRVRLITVGDLFEDRFGGKGLAGAFAMFNVICAVTLIGFGYLVSFKTMEAMMVKPAELYSAAEAAMIEDYHEYVRLDDAYKNGSIENENIPRYETLKSLYNRDELRSYVSYVNPVLFYVIYGLVVGMYIVLGGFAAAVVTDAFQAILIIVFSFMLIPFGLGKLGGFSGLHDSVPDYMFRLFGSEAMSEYTWYSVAAILFASIVQIHAVTGNMAIAGSANSELSARMGAVTGGFGKRIMIIMWSLCALIAVGLYGGQISNPDMTWGVLTKGLLAPGLMGFMLAGILAANMSTLDAYAINLSALFVRNLYMPVVKDRSEKHYILVGRFAIVFFLFSGALVALYMTGVIALLKFIIVMNVTFGAPVLLIFFWRRLTKASVYACVVSCFIVIVILPWGVPAFESLRTSEALTVMTEERLVQIETKATSKDVETGIADEVGQVITKTHKVAPVACFFEKIAHVDPYDPNSLLEGVGTFRSEVYIVSLLGLDVKNMTPPMLVTVRFMFDGLFPFIVLFIVSLFTKRTDKAELDRFYVKMKTEVQPTPEQDELELEKSYANPERFDHLKLFPKSSWEFCKWTKTDFVGFVCCCMIVLAIVGLFWWVLNIGA
jgi:solute:Na+ symporter, SSS family